MEAIVEINIDPTDDERQALYGDIHRRNFFRKNAQLPLIDVTGIFARELALIREAKFRRILQPYIIKALNGLPETYGLPNRVGRQRRAEVMAYKRLIHDYNCDLGDLPIPTPISKRLFEMLVTR